MTVDHREKRLAYYCSREWGLKREAVNRRSGGVCERCHQKRAHAVHHKTYARLYNEPMEDLWHLCSDCHNFIHGRTVDPRSNKNPNLSDDNESITSEQRRDILHNELLRRDRERPEWKIRELGKSESVVISTNQNFTHQQLKEISVLGIKYNTRIDLHDFGIQLTMWKYSTNNDVDADKRFTENISYIDLLNYPEGPVTLVKSMLDIMRLERDSLKGTS